MLSGEEEEEGIDKEEDVDFAVGVELVALEEVIPE